MGSLRLLALCVTVVVVACTAAPAQTSTRAGTARLVRVGEGWAKNQINTVIFRRNSVISQGETTENLPPQTISILEWRP